VVKNYAVVKDAHLDVGEIQVVGGGGGEFFPVSNGVIAYVANGTPCEAEVLVGCCPARQCLFDDLQRVGGFLCGFVSRLWVAGGGGSVFYLDSELWVKS
jgi:hypothetical protein